jgi:hypothetical protein
LNFIGISPVGEVNRIDSGRPALNSLSGAAKAFSFNDLAAPQLDCSRFTSH